VVIVAEVAVSNAATATRMTGTIKWFDSLKGYGFIQGDDEKDYFVHRSGVKGQFYSMEAGHKVVFNIQDSNRGPVAIDIEQQ